MSRIGVKHAVAMLVAGAVIGAAPPARAIKVATWNLWAYPDAALATRQPLFRTAMQGLSPDILIVQELNSSAGADSFLTNVLNAVEPGQWARMPFLTLQAAPVVEGGCLFYKPSKVSVPIYTQVATAGPRDVLLARILPNGYTNISATFRIYSVHFKASAPDTQTRRLECTDLRNSINLAPAGTNFLVGGDTNFYGTGEGGYIRLTESQTDNDGRCNDPLNLPGVWNNGAYAPYHTQCPCLSGCLTGQSGGGLDDRFDLFLNSYSMADGEGVDILPTSYLAYGNDGNHYNDNINGGGFNTAVPIAIANALRFASDHIPVMVTVQVAAKVAAASQLDFGPVLIGATAQQTLDVSNPAVAPADELDYSFAAPAGFTAPGGGFQAQPGAAPNAHLIGMSTATVGTKSGTLAMSTDDRDSLTKNVLLSGTVLDHAVASLDSTTTLVSTSFDLGAHPIGSFGDSALRVHNRGWNPLQARLSLEGASITGGEGRFSIVGGFTPALIAGVGLPYTIRFSDAGATPDTTYEATLTLSGADEALPGALPASDLVVHLSATTTGGSVGVDDAAPLALRFYPPRPNPLTREASFAFDLPRESQVTIDVFDLGGRRVSSVVNAALPAGSHRIAWQAKDASGQRLEAGLYFARYRAGSLTGTRRLIVLP